MNEPTTNTEYCRCERESGRFWFQGEWRCKETKKIVRSYRGWKHYEGHRNMAGLIQYTEEQAA